MLIYLNLKLYLTLIEMLDVDLDPLLSFKQNSESTKALKTSVNPRSETAE